MVAKSHHEKLDEASTRSRHWLRQVEELEARGVMAGPEHDEAERKALFWLNRFNALTNKAEP